jgi:hypothetical protein
MMPLHVTTRRRSGHRRSFALWKEKAGVTKDDSNDCRWINRSIDTRAINGAIDSGLSKGMCDAARPTEAFLRRMPIHTSNRTLFARVERRLEAVTPLHLHRIQFVYIYLVMYIAFKFRAHLLIVNESI